MLGLCCCAGFSPVGESWGYSPGAVHRLLFVAEHAWASVVVTYRLLSSDSVAVLQAQLLCSTQHLPQPVIEPVSPALASRFFTSEPPGKPKNFLLNELLKKTMKFKFNWYIWLILKLITINYCRIHKNTLNWRNYRCFCDWAT